MNALFTVSSPFPPPLPLLGGLFLRGSSPLPLLLRAGLLPLLRRPLLRGLALLSWTFPRGLLDAVGLHAVSLDLVGPHLVALALALGLHSESLPPVGFDLMALHHVGLYGDHQILRVSSWSDSALLLE